MTERKKSDSPFPEGDRAEPQADGAPGSAGEGSVPEASPNKTATDRAPKKKENPAPSVRGG